VSSQLTPRERVLKAMAFEETDIVPYDIRIEDAALPSLIDYYGDPEFKRHLVSHLPFHQTYEKKVHWISPDYYIDDFGTGWRIGNNTPHIEHYPLQAPSLRGYHFPDLTAEEYFRGVENFFANHREYLTFCADAHGFFDKGWHLRGMENWLVDFALNPGFVQELLDALVDVHLHLVDCVATYPFDGIRFADDWGSQQGITIGADRWRKFIKPGLGRIFTRAREKGLIVMVHSDGNISQIIPDLIDIGVQILNPLQPEAMDVLEIKRRYGKRLCLNGGISTQYTLPRGTPQDVRREVQACLRYLGRGGGYVISPSKPILPDVPPANAHTLIEAIVNQTIVNRPDDADLLPDRVDALWRVYAAFHP
jgi:uroporphyrinogen decarboxylase